jgi:ketosteroid isomerase-like protein
MQRGPLQVSIGGNTAWVASTGRLQGTFQARAVDVATAELMVLSRTASGWEIRAIHWSSR